jgi:hypothetical protein
MYFSLYESILRIEDELLDDLLSLLHLLKHIVLLGSIFIFEMLYLLLDQVIHAVLLASVAMSHLGRQFLQFIVLILFIYIIINESIVTFSLLEVERVLLFGDVDYEAGLGLIAVDYFFVLTYL